MSATHRGGALEKALIWPWGIMDSRGALGSEALEAEVAIHLKSDSAKSRRGCQPEAEFRALPRQEWSGALLGGAPRLQGVQRSWLQAWERMKMSIFILGNRLKHQRRRSRMALPSKSPRTPTTGAHRGGLQESDRETS